MLAPWKKSYDKPRQHIKKQRHYFATMVCLVKAMVFPVLMNECESWTIKKAEHRRIAFELWCWRRLLRVPWTPRGSNQSILKEISPEYSLEGLMLKLKLHYFGHLMWKTDSFEKTLMLGNIEGRRRDGRGWDGWMASLNWTEGNKTPILWKFKDADERNWRWHKQMERNITFLDWKNQHCQSDCITQDNPRVCLVTQTCLTLCNPMDYRPPGSSVHGGSPGKNTGVGCHTLL